MSFGRSGTACTFLSVSVIACIAFAACNLEMGSSRVFTGKISAVPDPHNHPENPHLQTDSLPELTEIMPELPRLLIFEAEPPRIDCVGSLNRQCEVLLSENARWRATIAQEIERFPEETIRFRLEDRTGNRVYRIEGLPFPSADISDPVFYGNRFLIFDRWHNNNYAVHFVIDLSAAKLILAAACPHLPYFERMRELQMQDQRKSP